MHMFTTDHWLSCRKNVIILRLSAPAWVGAELVSETASKREQMLQWTVSEVAAFLQSKDLQGPATVCLFEWCQWSGLRVLNRHSMVH